MPFPSLILYILSLASLVAAWGLVLNLVKKFRLHFLSLYMGYLVAINITGFVNLVVSDLASEVLRDFSPEGMRMVYALFGLVAFPLMAIACYFFLAFITGILDETISPLFRAAYIILWIVLSAEFLIRIQHALEQKDSGVPQILSRASGAIIILTPLIAVIYLMLRTARRPHAEEGKGLMTFAVISLVSYLLFLAAFSFSQAGSSLRWAVPFCFFLASIAPVQALRKILSRYGRPILPEAFADPRMQRFRSRFQLSAREGEVLDLLLKGKSNKSIEKELFISPHTVRNHVHNIYQKLNISSRLQLMNLVRTWLEADPSS